MAELQKAMLQKVKPDETESKIGEAVPVQFNPTSLRLKLSNQVESGRSNARPRRQQTGANSNVLSMDLVFDTGDEGTALEPVSVRTRTAIVEEFVVPAKNSSQPPPRLQFQWNDLILTGIVESVDIDFDLFAANGVPLRAKVSLSIKEQTPEYQFLSSGPGAGNSSNATAQGNSSSKPGGGTNDPTGGGGKTGDQSAPALDGELPAEFAARMGLDPAAWRGLAANLSGGLSLEAGVEVGFSAGLSAGVGIGVSAGVQASVGTSLEASLGLGGGASVTTRVNGDDAGIAMAEAGGVEASIGALAISKSTQAASSTAKAFGIDVQVNTAAGVNAADAVSSASVSRNASAQSAAATTAQSIVRTPLKQSGRRSHSQQLETPAASAPPQPDPRSVSYGFGVPLQPLRKTALDPQQVKLCSVDGSDVIEPPFRTDPTVAPWVALPPVDKNRKNVDALEQKKQANPCRLVSNWCECDPS